MAEIKKNLDTFSPHEMHLVATERRSITLTGADGQFVSTVLYDTYTEKGFIEGRRRVLMDVELFESMVTELDKYRAMLAPIGLPEPITANK